MHRFLLGFFLKSVSFILLIGSSCMIQAKPLPHKIAVLDRMIASVNHEAITESELQAQTQLLLVRLRQMESTPPPLPILRKQLLEKIILEKLQLQLASEQGIEVDATTLDQTIQELAARDGLSIPQMQQFLKEQGITFEQFRTTLKKELIISKLQQKEVGQTINISKAEIEAFLNSPAGQDESGVEYHLGHILIAFPEDPSKEQLLKIEARAEALAKELQAGGDFAKAAIAKSDDQQALKGGDLGWRKLAAIPTVFSKVVSAMHVNEIYGPIRDSSGFHIIKLLGKRRNEVSSQEQIKEIHFRQILIKKKMDPEAKTLLGKLRKQIVAGASFENIAQKYSEDPNSRFKGGDMGWINPAELLPAFNVQLNALKPGEMSEPFKTELGWHILQFLGKRVKSVASQAGKTKAMEILYHRKFDEALSAWLRRLKVDAEIEIYLNES